jgi:hypothetical protein
VARETSDLVARCLVPPANLDEPVLFRVDDCRVQGPGRDHSDPVVERLDAGSIPLADGVFDSGRNGVLLRPALLGEMSLDRVSDLAVLLIPAEQAVGEVEGRPKVGPEQPHAAPMEQFLAGGVESASVSGRTRPSGQGEVAGEVEVPDPHPLRGMDRQFVGRIGQPGVEGSGSGDAIAIDLGSGTGSGSNSIPAWTWTRGRPTFPRQPRWPRSRRPYLRAPACPGP